MTKCCGHNCRTPFCPYCGKKSPINEMGMEGLTAHLEWLISNREGKLKYRQDRTTLAKAMSPADNDLAKYRSWYKLLAELMENDKRKTASVGVMVLIRTMEQRLEYALTNFNMNSVKEWDSEDQEWAKGARSCLASVSKVINFRGTEVKKARKR